MSFGMLAEHRKSLYQPLVSRNGGRSVELPANAVPRTTGSLQGPNLEQLSTKSLPAGCSNILMISFRHRRRCRIRGAAPCFVWQNAHLQHQSSTVCYISMAEPRFIPWLSIQHRSEERRVGQ